MFQTFRTPLAALLGLVLSIFGIVHTVTCFPGLRTFAAVWSSLPALATVSVFVLGLVVAAVGILLLACCWKPTPRPLARAVTHQASDALTGSQHSA
jgi:hypothetical protein